MRISGTPLDAFTNFMDKIMCVDLVACMSIDNRDAWMACLKGNIIEA